MNRFYASLIILLLFASSVCGQMQLDFTSANVSASGQTVDIDVRVSGFTEIVSMQLSLNWDATVFSYSSIENVTEVLPMFTESNNFGTPTTAQAVSDGQLTVSWSQSSTQAASIPNNTRLFTLRLTSTGDLCDETAIVVSNTPRVIEVVNDNFDILTIDVNGGAIAIDDGTSCMNTGGNGIGLYIDDVEAPEGGKLCIPITATDFNDIESLQLGIKWDPAILAYDSETGVTGVGISPINVNATRVSQGELNALWFFESAAVSVPDNGVLFEVCFDVIGDTGGSTSVEMVSFPDASPPFGIEISRNNEFLNFFTDSGTFTVGSGTGEQIGVGFIIDDLFANGASNICVPISTANFDSMVAFMSGISFDPQILSYSGFNNLALSNVNVADQQKENGELRVLWTEQNANPITLDDDTDLLELCFDVIGAEGARSEIGFINIPPNFSIEAIEFPANPTDFYIEDGSVTVGNEPTPPDSLSITVSDALFDMGDTVCVDFTVNKFVDISGMSFVASWDETILQYVGPRNLNLDGLTAGQSNFVFVEPNSLRVLYTPTDGQTVADGTSIFQLCYVAIPGCDSDATSEINIGSDSNIALEFIGPDNQTVPVIVNSATVSADDCIVLDPVINLITLSNPNCPGDLNGGVLVEFMNLDGTITCSWVDSDGTVVSDNCNLAGQSAGTYTLTATDENDRSATMTYTIEDPSAVDTTGVDLIACADSGESNGEITINLTGGTAPYTITSTSAGTISGLNISDIPAGEITFMVQDAEGCDYMFGYNVTVCPDDMGPATNCDVVRSIISPNGDGMNETFVIGCLNDPATAAEINDLSVYNRWGELVFAENSYQNNWNGTNSDGTQLDEGGYMWVLNIGGPTNRQIFRGTLTVLR